MMRGCLLALVIAVCAAAIMLTMLYASVKAVGQ